MHTKSWHAVGLTLDECIKCNICTSYCPVSAVTDEFPGPKYVGPQAQRFREIGQALSPDLSVDYCSSCRVCNEVCPAGVKIAEINARARAQIVQEAGVSLRNRLLGRNELLGRLGSYWPSLANRALQNPAGRVLVEKVLGIARHAPLPSWSTEGTFRDWWASQTVNRRHAGGKVIYFHGCSTMYYEPFVGMAAVAVLAHNGYEVIVPPQNCCGLPMLSNGEFDAADDYFRRNVDSLVAYAKKELPIVGTSTSCTLTLKEEAPELLDADDDDARVLTQGVWDLFEWLRERHDDGELRLDFEPLDMVLPYHQPCQYRAHRVGTPALDLLSLIPGLDLRESHVRCCGIAGTYGYKVEKYEISMDVGEPLFEFVSEQESDVVMTACDSETCRWQLEHGTGLPSRHPIEILATAYGLYDLMDRRLISAERRFCHGRRRRV